MSLLALVEKGTVVLWQPVLKVCVDEERKLSANSVPKKSAASTGGLALISLVSARMEAAADSSENPLSRIEFTFVPGETATNYSREAAAGIQPGVEPKAETPGTESNEIEP